MKIVDSALRLTSNFIAFILFERFIFVIVTIFNKRHRFLVNLFSNFMTLILNFSIIRVFNRCKEVEIESPIKYFVG